MEWIRDADMKKAVVAMGLIMVLLITATAGAVFVNLTKALQPEIEYKTPPIILVHSPENNKTLSFNSALLNFTVTKPDYWLTHGGYAAQQILKSVNYQLDEKYYDQIPVNSTLASAFDYSVNLTNLTDGLHSLKVHAYASGWVIQMNGFYEYEVPINSSSDNVYFTVDTASPRISVFSLENKTYYMSSVPLNFAVDELNSQIKYSLDGQENASIAGNMTLTNLPYGEHYITVFATDEAGNTGASETIYFTLSREPEPEPFPTVSVAAVSVAVVVLVAAGFLVYHKKRMSWGNTSTKHQTLLLARFLGAKFKTGIPEATSTKTQNPLKYQLNWRLHRLPAN